MTTEALPWVYDDGGRAAAGFRGEAGDCVTRAVAIATEVPYRDVYAGLKVAATRERPKRGRRSTVRDGVRKPTVVRYLTALGWTFTPTMAIGSGTTVHLRRGEVPDGRLVVSLSKHYAAVIDGVVRDTHDPTRDGTRCVYGYWTPATPD